MNYSSKGFLIRIFFVDVFVFLMAMPFGNKPPVCKTAKFCVFLANFIYMVTHGGILYERNLFATLLTQHLNPSNN